MEDVELSVKIHLFIESFIHSFIHSLSHSICRNRRLWSVVKRALRTALGQLKMADSSFIHSLHKDAAWPTMCWGLGTEQVLKLSPDPEELTV